MDTHTSNAAENGRRYSANSWMANLLCFVQSRDDDECPRTLMKLVLDCHTNTKRSTIHNVPPCSAFTLKVKAPSSSPTPSPTPLLLRVLNHFPRLIYADINDGIIVSREQFLRFCEIWLSHWKRLEFCNVVAKGLSVGEHCISDDDLKSIVSRVGVLPAPAAASSNPSFNRSHVIRFDSTAHIIEFISYQHTTGGPTTLQLGYSCTQRHNKVEVKKRSAADVLV